MAQAGVVHVGAHLGEEVPGYLTAGYTSILCFEPQFERPADMPEEVQWVNIALGDRMTMAPLYIPRHLHDATSNDTMSASLYEPDWDAWAKLDWPPRKEVIDRQVGVVRFDEWAHADNYDPSLYSLLVVDVQGMELPVLMGFGKYLQYFSKLVIECSAEPIYKGGATAQQVINYLFHNQGFVYTSAIKDHGDITFVKASHQV